MEEEKKEEVSIIPTIVCAAVILIVLGLISYQIIPSFDRSGVDHLTNVINARNQSSMSDDYIRGWMDCIAEYDWWKQGVTNATNQMKNYTL